MKLLLAPAKKMQVAQDDFAVQSQPLFLKEAATLQQFLQSRSQEQLLALWNCKAQTAQTALKHLHHSLASDLSPAIFAFSGIQYQYLAADVLPQPALDYLQANLRILSGFYGLLKPFDGVIPYRLELKTKMTGFIDYSLYHFWGNKVAQALFREDNLLINLASKEYSRLISPYLTADQKMVTIVFQEQRQGKWRTIGTHAKMARGEMVRFCAQRQIKSLAELQDFHDFGFAFCPQNSTADQYVFRSRYDFKRH
jgi:cytoplasmic iron level regulating protein YaaA (DUF328/UPF0246 family)